MASSTDALFSPNVDFIVLSTVLMVRVKRRGMHFPVEQFEIEPPAAYNNDRSAFFQRAAWKLECTCYSALKRRNRAIPHANGERH